VPGTKEARVATREATSMAVVVYSIASLVCPAVRGIVHANKYIQRNAVPKTPYVQSIRNKP